MIHFPTPKRSLAAFSDSAQLSIKKCDKIVRDKTGMGFRKSGAEYFLGKGIGLYAIVTSQEFRWLESKWETKWETKTDFWRSREISEKLERVCGQKDVNFKGVITYQGIQLRFDETRYPYESKDDLWFYIGFSVAGPYAYDPVDNDTYDVLRRKLGENLMPNIQASEVANPKNPSKRPVSRRGKLRELRNSITKRSQEVKEAEAENIVLSGAFSSFPCSTPRSLLEKPISSFEPHFPASTSRQFSCASALPFGPSIREEGIKKVATKQKPVGTTNDTPHKPRPRKGKKRDSKHSIMKQSQKPEKGKAKNLDALSDNFISSSCSNSQWQAEKSISSSLPHFLNVLPSDCPDNPTVALDSTLSLTAKRLPRKSSWGSADNIHHRASSSRQVSSTCDLQLKPTKGAEQMTKIATKQELVTNCDDTHYTPNPRKEKLDDLKYSVTKNSQKPGEDKVEILDALSDGFNGKPKLQAEKSISSSMPDFLNVSPGHCSDNPTEAPNTMLSSNSTRLPVMSSSVSTDNLHHQTSSSKQLSYASDLQRGPTKQEEHMTKDATKQEPVVTCNDTRHTPSRRKGKLRGLKFSIIEGCQKPDNVKAEKLTALSNNFTGSPSNNPQLQAEKSICSSMPDFLNGFPNDCPGNPSVAPNSALSSTAKRLPRDSADSIHNRASSSRQVSFACDLQLKPTIGEGQMTKIATKQEPVGTCDDTHDTPTPFKEKSGHLKYSIKQRIQTPDEDKVEILDALSDDFNGNPKLQAENSISSSMPDFLNVSPRDCLQNPTEAPKSSLSLSTKRFPGMSSWDSADNIHHQTFSSRQVSYACALQLGPTIQEEKMTKNVTKQGPVGACIDTHHTPNSRKGKLGALKYSITKRSQKPDEGTAEVLDVLSNDSYGSSCSNPQLQAKISISSSMPHFLNVLPNDCLANPTVALNSSWDSADNLNHATTRPVSFASALQFGGSRPEEHITEAATRQQKDEPNTLLPAKDRWKKVLGTKGIQKQLFQPRNLDETGKLHHGSCVLGAEKSRECTKHTNEDCDIGVTSRCRFAHSWRGDTLQYVCIKCTRNNKDVCKEKIDHEMYIWNLGPYYKEDGTIWKETPQ